MQQAFLPIVAAALLACTLHAGANAAGVEVRYDASKIHSDAGDTAAQRERRLEALAENTCARSASAGCRPIAAWKSS